MNLTARNAVFEKIFTFPQQICRKWCRLAFWLLFGSLTVAEFSACATYTVAGQVKVLALSTDLNRGKSVGTVRGEDCTWTYFGFRMQGPPSLERALAGAHPVIDPSPDRQASIPKVPTEVPKGVPPDAPPDLPPEAQPVAHDVGHQIRYIEDANTQTDGSFNAGLVAKNCITVTGTGYE